MPWEIECQICLIRTYSKFLPQGGKEELFWAPIINVLNLIIYGQNSSNFRLKGRNSLITLRIDVQSF